MKNNLIDLFSNREKVANLKGTHRFDVSPSLAKLMLMHNTKNRPTNTNWVAQLAGRMANGEWQENGDTIRFSNQGILLDGQHRLYAIIKSGKTIALSLVFGLLPEAFQTIDDNRKRSPSDVLANAGYSYYHVLAAAARIIPTISGDSQTSSGISTALSNMQILDFVEENPRIYDLVSDVVCIYNKGDKLIPKSELLAFCFLFDKKDSIEAMKFIEMLSIGEGLLRNHPVFVLRKRLTKGKINKDYSIDPKSRRKMIAITWNSFRSGLKTKQIRSGNVSKMPKLI